MAAQLGPWHISEHIATSDSAFTLARTLIQVHEGTIITATSPSNRGDGWLLHATASPVAIRTADCLPLILTTATTALALHISRKTLLHDIVPAGLKLLGDEKITGLYIGPHICQRHFIFEEEGAEVKEFIKKFPAATARAAHGTTLSLQIALDQFIAPLLRDESVTKMIDQRCTYQTHKLPSYKRWLTQDRPGTLPHLFTVVSGQPLPGTTPDSAQ